MLGLGNLGLFNMIYYVLTVPTFLSLYAAHRRVSPTGAGLATIFWFLGITIYISTNTAYPTRKELARLFDVAERTRGRGAARTHETIVKTPAWTGMRREELCRLAWDDVSFEQQMITVRDGKGGRDRVIPMHRQSKHVHLTAPQQLGRDLSMPDRFEC